MADEANVKREEKNRLKRESRAFKRATKDKQQLLKTWEKILKREGLSMHRGHDPHKVTYVGTTNDLVTVETAVFTD